MLITEAKILGVHNKMKLEHTRVRMMYESLNEGLIPYYIWLLTLLAMLAASGANLLGLTAWLLVVITIEVIEARYRKRFFDDDTIDNPHIWERYMLVCIGASALTISMATVLFLDFNEQLQLSAVCAFVVVPALVSSIVFVSSIRAQYVWVLGLLLPIVIQSWLSDITFLWIIGATILFAAIPIAMVLGKKAHEDFLETLRLRFENSDLLLTAQTERAKAERERARAEKASTDKMRFLASASHDLRQPTHALELFSDALEHELDKPVQFELMDKIKESTAAMNGLLYSLLDISKLDAGVIKVNKSSLLMKDLLSRMVQSIQSQADKKGVNIIFKETPCAIISDPVLLESILHNLLSNALKYTDTGHIEITCTETTTGKIKISIKDTGIGISEDDKKLVFDEFIQLGNPERDRAQGLGLGLSIVKRTCALLGHRLEMQSEIDVGSVFSVELEAANIADTAANPQEARQVNSITDATVLVIDDERTILDGMQQMLSRWGFSVLCAVSSQQALKLLQSHAGCIDIIVADYRLGEAKLGTDAIAEVKHALADPNIPAIIITGDTGSEQLQSIEEAGYHVLHKPIAALRVRVLIQNLLKQRKKA